MYIHIIGGHLKSEKQILNEQGNLQTSVYYIYEQLPMAYLVSKHLLRLRRRLFYSETGFFLEKQQFEGSKTCCLQQIGKEKIRGNS